jgi:protein-tyrosine phosphatase
MSSPLLPSAPAMRDLGGLPTDDGRRLRAGQLFRSGVLAELPPKEREVVAHLGLRLVCDLRSASERSHQVCADWLVTQPRRITVDLAPSLESATASALARMIREPGPSAALEIMLGTYAALPGAVAPHLRSLFSALAAGETPALIHCSAGKDRTGFVVAILLHVLGVRAEDIRGDYLREMREQSDAHAQRTAHMMALFLEQPLDAESTAIFGNVRAEFLDASYAVIERDHGSLSAYVVRSAGIDAPLERALRERFVEAA